LGVVDPDAVACAALDEHFVSGCYQLAHFRRHQADAVFMNLDFPAEPRRASLSPSLLDCQPD